MELTRNGTTMDYVIQRFRSGHITEDVANEFFKLWCLNKLYHQWNDLKNRPEVAVFGRREEFDHWREFSWHS